MKELLKFYKELKKGWAERDELRRKQILEFEREVQEKEDLERIKRREKYESDRICWENELRRHADEQHKKRREKYTLAAIRAFLVNPNCREYTLAEMMATGKTDTQVIANFAASIADALILELGK